MCFNNFDFRVMTPHTDIFQIIVFQLQNYGAHTQRSHFKDWRWCKVYLWDKSFGISVSWLGYHWLLRVRGGTRVKALSSVGHTFFFHN